MPFTYSKNVMQQYYPDSFNQNGERIFQDIEYFSTK